MYQLLCRKPFVQLVFLFIAFSLTGCTAFQKSIEPYGESPPPSADRQEELEASKPLPDIPGADSPFVPSPEPETAPREAVDPSAGFLPVLTLVADRIAAYEGKLRMWMEFRANAEKMGPDEELDIKIIDCQGELQSILDGYNQLHEKLIRESSGRPVDIPAREQLLRIGQDDIGFLESECQQIIQGPQESGGWLAATRQRVLEESEKNIGAAMAAGDYEQVVALYEQLPGGVDVVPSFDTVFNYGNALLKMNRSRDAGQVFQDLLKRYQQRDEMNREFQLMQHIADIHFSLEDYAKSFELYVNIINRYAGLGDHIDWARKQQSMINARNQRGEEVKSFASLMLAHFSYNPHRDGFKVVRQAEDFVDRFPESTAVPTVNRILFESRDIAEKWFAMQLQQLNRLKSENEYSEALQFIEQLPLQELPLDKRAYITDMTDELIAAQFQEAEAKRLELESTLKETWERGQEHLRAREYDLAIEVFAGLLDTPYGERAREQIEEAANLSAQDYRRKAAELFVRANDTSEKDGRLKLLLESRRVLQDILVKYPQSDVVDKVRNNLDRIEQEIMAVDPSLLSAPAADIAP
jgi:tetratricopeptide (TPR) repeat protein